LVKIKCQAILSPYTLMVLLTISLYMNAQAKFRELLKSRQCNQ